MRKQSDIRPKACPRADRDGTRFSKKSSVKTKLEHFQEKWIQNKELEPNSDSIGMGLWSNAAIPLKRISL
jgi:hypothetical protein